MLDRVVATAGPVSGGAPVGQRHSRSATLLVAGLCVAGYAGWLLLDDRGLHSLAPIAAGIACWTTHRQGRTGHSGWAWLAGGALAWTVGSLAEPTMAFAAPAYLLYAALVAFGLSRFPRALGSAWAHWTLVLDGVVIAGSLLLVSFVWAVTPVIDHAGSTWTRLGALAHPLADVVVVTAVLTGFLVWPRTGRGSWSLLSSGLLVLSVSDSLAVASAAGSGWGTGGLLDLGRVAGFVLVALAGTPRARAWGAAEPPEAGRPQRLVQQLVPYAAIAVATVSVFSSASLLHSPGRVWLGLPLIATIALRQLVVSAGHSTLARDLAEAVDRRTEELRHREQWWRDLVQNLSDVVAVIDPDGGIRYCSPSAVPALGYWPQLAKSATELKSHIHPDDVDEVLGVIRPVLLGHRRNGHIECRIERSDASWGWFEVTAVGQLAEQSLRGTVLTLHDVSERRRLTDQLTHEAHHDSLTGLPNRTLLMKRIEKLLANRGGQRSALLLLDLDDFKVINDRHGHAAGDVVLEVIGRRLRKTVRAGDTVARLGGDEFALLMNGTSAQVLRTADRLIAQIGKPVVAGGRRFLVRASIGVVFAGEDRLETAQSMLSHADIALYEAKARDKGGIVVIEGHERDAAAKKVHLREQIAQPDLEQFSVLYQPIVDLTTGWVRGVESLLRWNHPDLGAVLPDEFIPMAEAGGSIQYLGWHVLTEACEQLARWKQEAPEHRLAVGVNVSSRQLDEPGFARRVLGLIDKHDIDPAQIVLELTEQSLSIDFETAVAVVADLRAGGVSVAVDDYGTGYSSLRYLHRFAADVVKIDRSFIANLEGSVHTQKIVRSVMDMANSLDLQSIAEGIETHAQLELIRGLGCELGQGFLFSRPVSAVEISAMLAAGDGFTVATGALPMPTR